MKILINELLSEKEKTLYWLSKETGSSWQNLKKLANNETDNVKFSILDRICTALDCKIEDIMKEEKLNQK